MERNIGLVLSGGGVKGSYEIGVYQALSDLGITPYIDGIAGTSVGALNAVLLDSVDISTAAAIWEHLTLNDLLHFTPNAVKYISFSDFLKNGLPFNQEGIAALIDTYIDFSRLQREIYVTCTKIPDMQKVVFDLRYWSSENQKNIILASSALPVIYTGVNGVQIAGNHYIDGGITDSGNTPIDSLYDRGWRSIIAVYLKPEHELQLPAYPYAEIVRLFPSQDLGNKIIFNQKQLQRNIALGYEDTMEKKQELLTLLNRKSYF